MSVLPPQSTHIQIICKYLSNRRIHAIGYSCIETNKNNFAIKKLIKPSIILRCYDSFLSPLSLVFYFLFFVVIDQDFAAHFALYVLKIDIQLEKAIFLLKTIPPFSSPKVYKQQLKGGKKNNGFTLRDVSKLLYES